MRFLLILGTLTALAGCANTVGGFIQDSENVGDAVADEL